MIIDINSLRELLSSVVGVVQLILEALSVLCVLIGLVRLFILVFKRTRYAQIRNQFGHYLALALEFQLAADILLTTVDPDFDTLMKLAVIALIRTFLNYFLSKELESDDKKKSENQPG